MASFMEISTSSTWCWRKMKPPLWLISRRWCPLRIPMHRRKLKLVFIYSLFSSVVLSSRLFISSCLWSFIIQVDVQNKKIKNLLIIQFFFHFVGDTIISMEKAREKGKKFRYLAVVSDDHVLRIKHYSITFWFFFFFSDSLTEMSLVLKISSGDALVMRVLYILRLVTLRKYPI